MKINQSLAPQNGAMQQRGGFSQIIGSPNYQRMLETAISDPKRRSTFVSSLISAVATVPKLKDCTTDSIISAALPFVSFDFQFGVGLAYIIPYGDKARFQMGAKGYRQLAMRSGQYRDLDTIEVRQGEFLGRDESNGKPLFRFITDEDVREELPIIGYLAYFELLSGFKASVYFSKEKMIKWANRYSEAFDVELDHKYKVYLETGEGLTKEELRACSSPWYSNFDGMAEKTVLKQLLSKKGILSVELVNAFEAENDRGSIDNGPMFNSAEPVREAPVSARKPEPDPAQVPVNEDGEIPAQQEPEQEEPTEAPKKRGRKPKGANEETMDALFFDGQED